MKLSSFFISLLLLIGSRSVYASEWQLVWSDDFHYTGLPDPAKWTYDVGYCRNREPQYYTEKRLENARVEDGMLTIEARKEVIPNPKFVAGSSDFRQAPFTRYTSASLRTSGLFDFTYGRFEIIARFPSGTGLWPAFWTLGSDADKIGWPACGEIDVMECFGADKNFIYSTLHYGSRHDRKSMQGKQPIAAPLQGFHTYAAEWRPDRIDFFLDDHKYYTFDIDAAGKGPDNPFRKPHCLLLDLALSAHSNAGPIDESLLPAKFLIRSVRVFQDRASTTQPSR